VGLRLRDPGTPKGYRMEVFINDETHPKMTRLLDIVGGRILDEERGEGWVRLVVEKADAEKTAP